MIAPLAPDSTEQDHRPTGARAEAREQAILDAALELVLEVGYDRLSMDALAERAHAGKATIYRHWSGKAEVVAEAVRQRQCEEVPVTDTGSLRGDLLATIKHIDASVSSEDGALISGVLCAMRTDPVLANLMRTQVVESKRTNRSANRGAGHRQGGAAIERSRRCPVRGTPRHGHHPFGDQRRGIVRGVRRPSGRRHPHPATAALNRPPLPPKDPR